MCIDIFHELSGFLLEAEVHPNQEAEFRDKYISLNGMEPPVDANFQIQTNKWGSECRIYFNANDVQISQLQSAGYHIEDAPRSYRDEYQYRINNNDLFWSLIEAGYQLGVN